MSSVLGGPQPCADRGKVHARGLAPAIRSQQLRENRRAVPDQATMPLPARGILGARGSYIASPNADSFVSMLFYV